MIDVNNWISWDECAPPGEVLIQVDAGGPLTCFPSDVMLAAKMSGLPPSQFLKFFHWRLTGIAKQQLEDQQT